MLRGVRGAVQAAANDRDSILEATEGLMRNIMEANQIHAESVSAAFFTVTPDLNAAFPAEVRKRIGWQLVPFLCSQEIPVQESLPRIIRVLIVFKTSLRQDQIRHQYVGTASALRPDLGSQ